MGRLTDKMPRLPTGPGKIRPSGIIGGLRKRSHGGNENPTRNRKSGLGSGRRRCDGGGMAENHQLGEKWPPELGWSLFKTCGFFTDLHRNNAIKNMNAGWYSGC